MAAWRPDGRLTHLLVLSAVDGFRASPPAGPLSLYRVQRGQTTQVAAPATGPDLARTAEQRGLNGGFTLTLRDQSGAQSAARIVDGDVVQAVYAGHRLGCGCRGLPGRVHQRDGGGRLHDLNRALGVRKYLGQLGGDQLLGQLDVGIESQRPDEAVQPAIQVRGARDGANAHQHVRRSHLR